MIIRLPKHTSRQMEIFGNILDALPIYASDFDNLSSLGFLHTREAVN